MGLIPGIGGTQRLAKMIGKNLAMQYILTGDTIDASKLKTFGTVEVLPTDDFDNKVVFNGIRYYNMLKEWDQNL